MSTVYTWNPNVAPQGTPPAPSTAGSVPSFQSSKKQQFVRGIKFGNVPGGRADNVVHGTTRIWHVNTQMNVAQSPCSTFDFGGAIKFQGRKLYKYRVPSTISHAEGRNTDLFGNVITPGVK